MQIKKNVCCVGQMDCVGQIMLNNEFLSELKNNKINKHTFFWLVVAFTFVLLGNEVDNKRGSFFSVFIFLVVVAPIFVAGVTLLLFWMVFSLPKPPAIDDNGLVIVVLLKSLLKLGVPLLVGLGGEKAFVVVWRWNWCCGIMLPKLGFKIECDGFCWSFCIINESMTLVGGKLVDKKFVCCCCCCWWWWWCWVWNWMFNGLVVEAFVCSCWLLLTKEGNWRLENKFFESFKLNWCSWCCCCCWFDWTRLGFRVWTSTPLFNF